MCVDTWRNYVDTLLGVDSWPVTTYFGLRWYDLGIFTNVK